MLFTEFGLKEPVLRGLKQLNYTQTTPIQEQTLQAFRDGKDIVGQSQTGTGKTAAFCLPLLDSVDASLRKVQAMILVPTRELAWQTQEELFNLGRFARIKSLAAYGGKSIRFQQKLIDQGMHIAVCTPGRAMDLIKRGMIDPMLIKYFVLDEVDRMLDMGFIDDVERLRSQCPNIEQTMLYSATVTKEVQAIINKHLKADHHFIQIEPEKIVVDRIDHAFVVIEPYQKWDVLAQTVASHEQEKIIIFTQTKRATSQVANFLSDKGFEAGQLSGDMEQRDRNASLKDYKTNGVRILVATDVASRGLNMKDIDLVINFDVPQDPESYVHRIGRTARAGKSGKALMFVTESELPAVYLIEKRNKITIPQKDLEGNIVERKRPQSSSRRSRFGTARRYGRQFDRRDAGRKPRAERNDHYGRSKSFSGTRAKPERNRFDRDASPFRRDSGRFDRSQQGFTRRESAERRPRRPSTKELMADFITKTDKPERGSYWERQ